VLLYALRLDVDVHHGDDDDDAYALVLVSQQPVLSPHQLELLSVPTQQQLV